MPIRFVDNVLKALLTAKIFFGRLDGGVAEQELDLIQLTSASRHVLDRESVANVQGLGSLPTVRLERKIGRLSAEIMQRLKDALAFALDLERASE